MDKQNNRHPEPSAEGVGIQSYIDINHWIATGLRPSQRRVIIANLFREQHSA